MLRTTFDIRYLEIAFLKSVILVSLINLIRENNKIYIYIYDSIQEKKYCFYIRIHFVDIQSSTINSTVGFWKKSLKNRSDLEAWTKRSSSFKNAWMKERSPRDGIGSGARVREPIAISYRDKWWNCCNMKGDIPKWSSRLWRQYVPLMWHAIALTMCSHIRYRYMCSGQWFFSLWSSLPFPAVGSCIPYSMRLCPRARCSPVGPERNALRVHRLDKISPIALRSCNYSCRE